MLGVLAQGRGKATTQRMRLGLIYRRKILVHSICMYNENSLVEGDHFHRPQGTEYRVIEVLLGKTPGKGSFAPTEAISIERAIRASTKSYDFLDVVNVHSTPYSVMCTPELLLVCGVRCR